MFTVTRNFTVSGDDFTVDMLGEYMVVMATRNNLTIISDEKFDDNHPLDPTPSAHDENTVWSREVRVSGSWLSMRAFARFMKTNLCSDDDAALAVA